MEWGDDFVELAADGIGAEVANGAFVGVVDGARGTVGSILHGMADGFVGFTEGGAREDEAVDILDREEVVVAGIVKNIATDTDMLQHEIADLQTAGNLAKGGEENILEELEVALVAEGEVGGHKGNLVREALQTVALGAHNLKDVGILLVRHDAAARSELVREGDKGEVLTHKETDIHGETPEGSCDGAESGSDSAFGLSAWRTPAAQLSSCG